MSATQADAAGAANASEAPFPEPETALESRGAAGRDSAPESDTGQAGAKDEGASAPARFGFATDSVAPFVPLKLGFPALWPDTSVRPLFFKLDYLLSEEADREQSAFLRLTDAEREAETYHFDARMIALLSCFPPEGLSDFEPPRAEDDFDPDNPEHRRELSAAVFAYLYRPGARESKALAFVARQVMSRYWARVNPREYL